MHVHVERGESIAKFWLSPVRLGGSSGFPRQEIARLQRIVTDHADELKESWNVYFES